MTFGVLELEISQEGEKEGGRKEAGGGEGKEESEHRNLTTPL